MTSVTIDDRISSVNAEKEELSIREEQLLHLKELQYKKDELCKKVDQLQHESKSMEQAIDSNTDIREKALLQLKCAEVNDYLKALEAEMARITQEERSLVYIIDNNKNFDKSILLKNIRALLRENADIKLGQIEKDAGCQPGYMSRLEKAGNTSDPSVEFIVTAAKAFGVSVDYLIKANLGKMEPTENYYVRFMQKLFIDTIDDKVKWAAVRKGALDTLNREPFSPLLYLVDMTGYGEAVFESHMYGKLTKINGTSFYTLIAENTYLYIMNVGSQNLPFSDKPSSALEVWMVTGGRSRKFICSSADSPALKELISNIYNLLVEWDEMPKIDEGVLGIIDAYMQS